MTFAVIKTGGKQYIVQEGDELIVEKLIAEDKEVAFDQVLLISDGEKSTIGQPFIKCAKVVGKIIAEGLGEKKIVFRYKSKTRQHKKKGHRQPFTKVKIQKISA